MITNLLKQAYSLDVELWIEDGKLKYRAMAGALDEQTKQSLIDNKGALIIRIEQNLYAMSAEWMVFEFGEMYSKRTGQMSDVCIFRNDDETFTAWRGTWRTGDSAPVSQTTLANNVGFDEAFARADNYCDWALKKPKRKRAS